jgi:hypothetical protein
MRLLKRAWGIYQDIWYHPDFRFYALLLLAYALLMVGLYG